MGGWYRGCAVVSKTIEKCSSRLPPANMLCYFSGRRLVLQTRGRWFESTTEYQGVGRATVLVHVQDGTVAEKVSR